MPRLHVGSNKGGNMKNYILNDENQVVEAGSLEQWAVFFGNSARRRVARTNVGGDVYVSTMFLGMGTDELFETMVFGGPLDQELWRTSTWDEAVKAHEAACKEVS